MNARTMQQSDQNETIKNVLSHLESEFKLQLKELRSLLCSVSEERERNCCNLWIQKFCEPAGYTVTANKNRNIYAGLLIRMLRHGEISEPFDRSPASGALPALPTSCSADYLYNSSSNHQSIVQPSDRLLAELSSEFRTFLPKPLTRSAMNLTDFDHISLNNCNQNSYGQDPLHSFQPNHSISNPLNNDSNLQSSPIPRYFSGCSDGVRNSSTNYHCRRYSFYGDPSLSTSQINEIDIRTKMAEARFQEESLKLQNRHDTEIKRSIYDFNQQVLLEACGLQILERKNSEIDNIQAEYKKKLTMIEHTNGKLEKTVYSLQKELSTATQTRDRQISELQKALEETSATMHAAYEKKVNSLTSHCEEERRSLEQKHSRQMSELMEETNKHLSEIDEEGKRQSSSTARVIRELESRIHQLSMDSESVQQKRDLLEKQKQELEDLVSNLRSQYTDLESRYKIREKDMIRLKEDHEKELRAVKSRAENHLESQRLEYSTALDKEKEEVSKLDQKLAELKLSYDRQKEQHAAELKKTEQLKAQELERQERLHCSKIKKLQEEMTEAEEENKKRIEKLERSLRESDSETEKLNERMKDQTMRYQKSLQDLKNKVYEESARKQQELQQELSDCKQEVDQCRQQLNRQWAEHQKQLKQAAVQHEQLLAEERERLQQLLNAQRGAWIEEKEEGLRKQRATMRCEVEEAEERFKERSARDTSLIVSLEEDLRCARGELMQASRKHEQEIKEMSHHVKQLSQLREEEKERTEREHTIKMKNLKSECEETIREIERKYTSEEESVKEEMNKKLKEINESSLTNQQKLSAVITDLNAKITKLEQELKRLSMDCDKRVESISQSFETEKKQLRTQHAALVQDLKNKLNEQLKTVSILNQRHDQQLLDEEEKITRLKTSFEEKMRLTVSLDVRKDLEETIDCLKSQVISLQQRIKLLRKNDNNI